MNVRRPLAALLAPLVLAAAASAEAEENPPQAAPALMEVHAAERAAARRDGERAARFRTQDSALGPDGMLAAVEVGDGLRIGVGRFTVPELARPRTWMERDRDTTDVRPRERGIAAFGVRLPF